MSRKKYLFTFKTKKIQVVLDKILLLRLMRKLNGRFWGIYGLLGLYLSLALCFWLTPELRDLSTAFSDFGTTVETSVYFSAGLFVAAYGLWRWRIYLTKSSKNPELITFAITLIILGLYMVAFLPLNISDTTDFLHYLGFAIVGAGMVFTVVVDSLLRRTRKSSKQPWWKFVRGVSLLLIVAGFVITLLSSERMSTILEVALVGESMILIGFSTWLLARTYQGEGVQTGFSRALNRVISVQ